MLFAKYQIHTVDIYAWFGATIRLNSVIQLCVLKNLTFLFFRTTLDNTVAGAKQLLMPGTESCLKS